MAEQARVPFSTVLPVPVVNRFRQVAISLPDPHTHADPDEDLDSGSKKWSERTKVFKTKLSWKISH